MATTILSAAQVTVFAILILLDLHQLWHVYLFAFAGGLIQSLTQPARQAFVYDVTTDDTLMNAVAMNSVMQNIARIAGIPLAGAVIGFWGTGTLFAGLAGAKLVAVAFTMMISTSTRQTRVAGGRGIGSALSDIRGGFVYSWRDREVLGLMVIHVIPTLLVIPYMPFIAVFATEVLHRGASGYGWLASMAGWGSVLGLVALTMMGDPRRKGLLMIAGFGTYFLTVLLFAFSTNYLLSLAALALAGVTSSIAFTLNNTLLQFATKNEYRGRVMSVWQVTAGLQPLGTLPMGYLIERYNPALGVGSFMVVALITLIVFTLTFGSVRRA